MSIKEIFDRMDYGKAPESAEMRFMDVHALTLNGAGCIVSRSGKLM